MKVETHHFIEFDQNCETHKFKYNTTLNISMHYGEEGSSKITDEKRRIGYFAFALSFLCEELGLIHELS